MHALLKWSQCITATTITSTTATAATNFATARTMPPPPPRRQPHHTNSGLTTTTKQRRVQPWLGKNFFCSSGNSGTYEELWHAPVGPENPVVMGASISQGDALEVRIMADQARGGVNRSGDAVGLGDRAVLRAGRE